jgi:hypothetical protein
VLDLFAMSPPPSPDENAAPHEYGPGRDQNGLDNAPHENGSDENRLSSVSRRDEELEIIQRQLRFPEIKASFFTLFRYATAGDFIIIAISTVCALAAGSILPIPPVYITFLLKPTLTLLIFYADYIWKISLVLRRH